MSSRNALSVVEQQYGSLEELAYYILENKQEALDESLPLVKRAEAVELPLLVFARILGDPMFRQLLRANLVNQSYGLAEEEAHIKHMVKVAVNEERKVVTNKGAIAWVDQLPTDVIQAGKYLNELRGTPVEGRRDSAFNGVVVNFEVNDGDLKVSFGDADKRTATPVTLEAEVHRPGRAGDLPPEPVPASRPQPARLPAASRPADDVGLGAFYGDSAREADEAHALAAKREGSQERSSEEEKRPMKLWPGPQRGRGLSAKTRNLLYNHRPPYDD